MRRSRTVPGIFGGGARRWRRGCSGWRSCGTGLRIMSHPPAGSGPGSGGRGGVDRVDLPGCRCVGGGHVPTGELVTGLDGRVGHRGQRGPVPGGAGAFGSTCGGWHRRGRPRSLSVPVDLHAVGGEAAGERLGELTGLYGEVYAEPPYCWGGEHRRCSSSVSTPAGRLCVGGGPGWWAVGRRCFRGDAAADHAVVAGSAQPAAAAVTAEYQGRTFAVVELLVPAPWRRRHIGRRLHDHLGLTGFWRLGMAGDGRRLLPTCCQCVMGSPLWIRASP
jgi:hypothetical protein